MNGTEFETCVLQIEARLYRIARAMLKNDQDAGDAIQEGILKAWQQLHRLRDQSRFDAWLTRIVINECRNTQRQYKRRPVSLDALAEMGTPPPDPVLKDALERLDLKYRLPLVLHLGEGFPVREVAALLRLPLSTVKWRLHEGCKLLYALLGEEAES